MRAVSVSKVASLWYPNGTNVTYPATNYHKALASLLNLHLPSTEGVAHHPVTYSLIQVCPILALRNSAMSDVQGLDSLLLIEGFGENIFR